MTGAAPPAGGPSLEIEDLGLRYPGRREHALSGLTLGVDAGELVGVAGRTGAGKSSLALAAAGFVPRVVRARLEGSVRVGGVPTANASASDLAGRVGIVFSTPANQLSASKLSVREELAFGLENLGVPYPDMDRRIDAILDHLGIGHLADREPFALSGGEQQRVAIASIVIMGTAVLVLDEPTAQLDPSGTAAVADLLRTLAADGRAVLCAEHAPTVLGGADRVLVLDAGSKVALDRPSAALSSAVLRPLGLDPPTLVALAEVAGLRDAAFDEEAIADGLRALAGSDPMRLADSGAPGGAGVGTAAEALAGWTPLRGEPPVSLDVRGLAHRYPGGVEALRGIDLSIAPGEAVAIVGQNGSGKTTLIKHFNGLLRPDAGSVRVGDRDIGGSGVSDVARQVGFVFQNPDEQLFNRSVEREVAFGPRNLRLDARVTAELVERALALTGLAEVRATNPYDLGLSIRKLVALASVLAMEPAILVLDEPTSGQDGPGIARVGAIAEAYRRAGRTVVAITHDMEFAARHFGRVVVMRDGRVALDGDPARVFGPDQAGLLATTGLVAPPSARIGARLGLGSVPTPEALVAALRGARLRRPAD